MPVLKRLFLGLLFYGIQQSGAQELFSRYTRYTTRDGLSHPFITCLAKDADGFLWVGTREGLCRYDGDRFLVMLKNSGSNSISNNQVISLCVADNYVFAGTAYGLNIINNKTLEVKNIYFNNNSGFKERANVIQSMMSAGKVGVWVNLLNGIALVDTEGNVLKQLFTDESKGSFAGTMLKITCVRPDGEPVLIDNLKEIVTPDFRAGKFLIDTTFLARTPLNKMDGILISSVSSSSSGEVYFVYGSSTDKTQFGKILQINPANHHYKLYEPKTTLTDRRYFQAFDIDDSLLLVTSFFGPPLIYNKNSDKSYPCNEPAGWFSSWPDGLGNSFLKDRDNLWVGSSKDLCQVKLGPPAFESSTPIDSILKNQSSLVNVEEVNGRGDSLAITCMGTGVLLFNKRNLTAQMYSYKPTDARYSISTFSFLKNADTIWSASRYGLSYIDLKRSISGLLKQHSKPAQLDSGVNISLVDRKGNFWFSTDEKIYCFYKSSQVFEEVKMPVNIDGYPAPNAISGMAEDESGNLYFGAYKKGGILKYHPVTKAWERVINSFEYKDFSSGSAWDLTIFKNAMYIHTKGAFAELNLLTKAYHIYTKIDGLSTTGINDIAVDKNGYVWIATTNGLNCFNPYLKNFTTYYMQDGLPADNVSVVGMIDVNKNLMYIGTEKAFRFFKPDLLRGENKSPFTIITGTKNLLGEKIKTDNGPLNLAYNNNDIEIEYTGINFENGSLNKYSYRLKGKDDDWIESGNKRSATYTNLPPGHYVFEVKSANRQGTWNDAPATLIINIKPPFWKTWWFYILVGVLIIAIIVIAFYYQYKKAKQRESEKININNQLNELRMKALRSQLNPHFIFNALNSIQSYVMDNNTVEASRYLSKFAKLFRLVLDNTDANFTTLQKEISLLSHYIELEALRFNHNFTFEIIVAENINVDGISVPSMLLQPHVENAILHGLSTKKNSKLLIRFKWYNESSICCNIIDNGIGRKRAAELKKGKFQTHESKGITILEQRTQILEAQYNLQSSYVIKDIQTPVGETGTEVIVLLPVKTVEVTS